MKRQNTSVKVITLLAFVISLLSVGCFTIDGLVAGVSDSPVSEEKVRDFPALSSNSRVDLEAATYRAPLISRNQVNIFGRGTVATVLYGDVRITGNKVSLVDLTIDGDAILEGNNINLSSVRVTGTITSSGSNNSW